MILLKHQKITLDAETLKKAKFHLAVATYKLTETHPYISQPLLALNLVPVQNMVSQGAGIGVDNFYRLYYDPEVIPSWTIPELSWILIHEVCGHLLRRHCGRGIAMEKVGQAHGLTTEQHMQFVCWAQESEINEDVKHDMDALGLKDHVRTNPLRPAGPTNRPIVCDTVNRIWAAQGISLNLKPGKIWEQYYHEMLEALKKHQDKACPQSGAGNGKGNPGDQQQNNCGSGAHGVTQPWDDPQAKENSNGSEDESPGISEAEGDIIARSVAKEIENHIKQKGSVGGGLQRWADELLNPKINWRDQLSGVVRRVYAYAKGQTDFSYRRPGRRSIDDTLIVPSLYSPVPRIGLGIDTSGSMSSREITAGVAEVKGILKAIGAENDIVVVSGDTDIKSKQRVRSADQVTLKGGGGTDMTRILKRMAHLKPRMDILILVTDMETNWPEEPLGVPLVIVGTSKHSSHYTKSAPEWAKVIIIDDIE